ncbi:LOW QUALITY PROTEIN: liprin-alpha-2-like [Lepeophtheirus salmonis]|uniref:LOW QUALITY PROTEIN: liprin-alpha-2-like n=1 Tax=Lepeophtheirus salmonis TaxID=72036 RepID=UPI003AF35CE3
MWNMMCDVMPTISEDSISQRSSQFAGDEANFEQLMVSMLDERDKLVESLKTEQDKSSELEMKAKDLEKERDSLERQMNQSLPQEFAALTKELNQARENVLEKEEEISELKAERNNTRLLLEHLECLVSRHERALRMTVVKRQAASQSGVSSEVEVLKALKSLFEHHKALDEKVRERLRVSLEKNSTLEEELDRAKDELQKVKSGIVEKPNSEDNVDGSTESNGTDGSHSTIIKISSSSVDPEVIELRKQIEKQSADLGNAHRNLSDLRSQKAELEEKLMQLTKDLHSNQELCKRLEIDFNENCAQKEDQEERISTLEKRYLNSQREATTLRDSNEKLQQELKNKEDQALLCQEKIKAITEKLDISEQKLMEFASMPDIEEQLRDRMEALMQAQERQGTVEDRCQRLEMELEEKSADLQKLSQRLKMNEEHNQRLSSTVDKLLSESNERLQVHLKERMHALEEKNHLSNELERLRKKLEETRCNKDEILKELQKSRLEIESIKRQMLQQEIHFNIKQTEALTRNLSPSGNEMYAELTKNISNSQRTRVNNDTQGGSSSTNSDSQSQQKKWQHINNREIDNVDFEDNESIFTEVMSPSGHTDAQTLACMLQEQLDAINNEIRLIQEEKQSTEQRAEELESRVGSIEHMNLALQHTNTPGSTLQGHQSYSISSSTTQSTTNVTVPPQPPPRTSRSSAAINIASSTVSTPLSFDTQGSPPTSGTSTPKESQYSQKYHTLHLSAPSQEINREEAESQRRIMDGSPPTPRSLRLLQLSASQEELRRTSMEDSSHSTPSPMSSAASSQDSLNRGPYFANQSTLPITHQASSMKKKGVKSTLGRIFGKKDKQIKSLKMPLSMGGGGFTVEYNCADISVSDSIPLLGLTSVSAKGDFDRRKKKVCIFMYRHELLDEAMKAGTPFALWNGPTIVAWLELWVGMPAWYVAACRANVKSGAIMSALSDTEIQREIGISNPLHRLKLRLAIQEMVSLTSPSAPQTSRTTLAYGDMNHEWIGNYWLLSLGLPQYRTTFMECLVDARMLDHLTKKDLRTQLKLVDSFHRTSLQYGIKCLKLVNFDRDQLEERRHNADLPTETKDVLVWSNEQIIQWVLSIGLKEYANNLLESGVHGALIALDEGFEHNSMALALQIPTQCTQARQLLETEFAKMVHSGTNRRLDEETATTRVSPS